MKLISLHIKNYKLFNDFKVDFADDKATAVFIGKNGSGKTTLVECISIIFGKLFECESLEEIHELQFPFNFNLRYLLRSEKIINTSTWGDSYVNYYAIELAYEESLKVSLFESDKNHTSLSTIATYLRTNGHSHEYLLPSSMVVYYSGISDVIYNLFKEYQTENILGSLDGDVKIDQPFYYFIPENFPLILITLLSFEFGDVPNKLLSKHSIGGFRKISLSFKRPKWAKPKSIAKDHWGAKGDLKIFLTRVAAIADEILIKSPNEVVYEITNRQSLIDLWGYYGTEKRLFEYLVALQANDLLGTVDVTLFKNGIDVTYQRLSEGEKQQLIIMGLKELLAAENSLFLLDEPDTYLHPSWKRDFIYELHKNENLYKNFYLITSHSPDIVSAMGRDQLFILINEENKTRLKHFSYNPFGKEVDNLLLEVFDVEDLRYIKVEKLIDELWDLIKEKKHESQKFVKLFEDLKTKIGRDDKAITEINIELLKREGRNEEDK